MAQNQKAMQLQGSKLVSSQSLQDNPSNFEINTGVSINVKKPMSTMKHDQLMSDRIHQMHYANERDQVQTREFAMCTMPSITKITQFLDLMRMSETKFGGNKIIIQQHNPVDVKPKSTNLIEPGEGFEPMTKDKVINHSVDDKNKDDSDIEDSLTYDETLHMIDQLANRKFEVRRGRNNRILAKAIVKNVFEDN